MAGIRGEWQEAEGECLSFLLRCWQESDTLNGAEPGGSDFWRFALVRLNGSSQTRCFASLEELLAFLSREFTK